LLFYPLCLPLISGGDSAKNNFSLFEEFQTGTIYSLPDFREGWGGYFVKI